MNLRATLYIAGALLGVASCKSDCRGGVDTSAPPIDAAVKDSAVGTDASCVGCTDGGAASALDLGTFGCALARAGTPPTKNSALDTGHAAAREKQWPAAAAAFCEAVALDSADAEALGELGWAQLQSGDVEHAEAAIRSALTLTSSPRVHAALVYNLAKISVARSDGGGSVRKSISLHKLIRVDQIDDLCRVVEEREYKTISCGLEPKNVLENARSTFDDVRVLKYAHDHGEDKHVVYASAECETLQFVLHNAGHYYLLDSFYDSCDDTYTESTLVNNGAVERAVFGKSSSDLVISWTNDPSYRTKAGFHTDSFMMVCTKSGEDAFCSNPIRYKVDDIPPPEELGGPGGPNDVPGFDLSYDFSPLGSVTFRVADGGSPLPPEAQALLGVHPLQITR